MSLPPRCTPVTVPPQSSYPGGSLMCTTCSTLLSAALVSGMMRDPATLTREECESHLTLVMTESAKLHQLLVQANTVRDPMLQIAEVVSFLEKNDHLKVFKLQPRTECFGLMMMQPSEQSDKDTFVGSLRTMLDTKMSPHRGAAAALTTRGHTICIYRSTGRWYTFDSLSGSLACVPGGTDDLYKVLSCAARAQDPFTAMVFTP